MLKPIDMMGMLILEAIASLKRRANPVDFKQTVARFDLDADYDVFVTVFLEPKKTPKERGLEMFGAETDD